MTQPALFAVADGEHSAVTEGGIIVPADAAERCAKVAEQNARADIAEFRCAEQLTLRGYSCTVLGGRFKGFDIIADRNDIRPQHIQVKHGFLDASQNRYLVPNKVSGQLYNPTAYDILVYYMWDRDQWLVYSRAEFGNLTQVSYTPPDLRKQFRRAITGTADRQPNNWELFGQLAMANSQESLGVTQPMSHPIPQNLPIP